MGVKSNPLSLPRLCIEPNITDVQYRHRLLLHKGAQEGLVTTTLGAVASDWCTLCLCPEETPLLSFCLFSLLLGIVLGFRIGIKWTDSDEVGVTITR